MKKFFNSVWFNIILAMLAASLIILQEVWIGAPIEILNVTVLGICAGLGFTMAAEVIKMLFFGGVFTLKNAAVGGFFGLVAAIATAAII